MDGHDARRERVYADAEFTCIVRMRDSWKTDLEGGRMPLVSIDAD